MQAWPWFNLKIALSRASEDILTEESAILLLLQDLYNEIMPFRLSQPSAVIRKWVPFDTAVGKVLCPRAMCMAGHKVLNQHAHYRHTGDVYQLRYIP